MSVVPPAVVIGCRTLGTVELTVDGMPAPPELLWRKHLALLVYLARSPRLSRSRDHLIGLLWGDRPEAAARHSLSEALRVVRRHAGQESLDVSVGQIGLAPGAVSLDVDQLEALTAAEDWAGAGALVGGEFLEGFAVPDASPFEDWLTSERALWRRRGTEALIRWADGLVRSGRSVEAWEPASRAMALEPTSEPAACAALRALALVGDRARALDLFQRFETRLAEMGVTPGHETVALAERIRRERGPRAAPAPAESPPARPPLGGRSDELARLLDGAVRSARTGRASLLLLEGEAGIGKSRLLEEMLTLLRLEGTSVAAARAVEGDRVEPGSGVLALARGGLLDLPGTTAAPPGALGALAAALPAWAERFPGATSAEPVPLPRALTEVVAAAAAEQPVVLALDDAQWVDPDSALGLGCVLRDLAAAPVTVVLATAPYPPRPELDELRSRIGRDIEGSAIRLRRLDRAALRHLAGQMLPDYDPTALDRVVRRVANDSAGLPLLAVELLRAVALGLDLGTISGAWPAPLHTLDQSLPGELPDVVITAIRIAARRLTPTAQRVLAGAAVLGDLATPPVLERALGLMPDEVGRALDELEWHRWLTAEPRGYSFVARIVRQVVERDMVTAGQRRRVLEAAAQPVVPNA
ncbi:MAG: AAA family ATPase [Gemmatimonadales bacterium]|jgi:DNA-binding SARP family transcriptional activator